MALRYDAIVIGTGAGNKLSHPLADAGQHVAVIEQGAFGGTCLNHGCIPSKMLIHPADVLRDLQEALSVNVHASESRIDYETLMARTTRTVDHASRRMMEGFKNHPNITLYPGRARFTGIREIAVNDVRLTSDRIFVATGVRARIPEIPGLAHTPYLTHKEILRLEKKPASLAILGGGFIALELAHFFAAAGVRVHVIARSSLLRWADADVRETFLNASRAHMTWTENAQVAQVQYREGCFQIHVLQPSGAQVYESEQLLVATGMVPNTEGLNLASTQVATHPDGHIQVDGYLRTTTPGIWAFGDVIGEPYYRHKANFEGEYLWRSLQEDSGPIVYPPMPWALFAYPQIAGFGPNEWLCQQQNTDIIVGKCMYADSGMGMAYNDPYGFVKLIFDRQTRRLIGATAIGPQAATLMHMPIAFARMAATIEDMVKTIYIHPALSETIRHAARDAAAKF